MTQTRIMQPEHLGSLTFLSSRNKIIGVLSVLIYVKEKRTRNIGTKKNKAINLGLKLWQVNINTDLNQKQKLQLFCPDHSSSTLLCFFICNPFNDVSVNVLVSTLLRFMQRHLMTACTAGPSLSLLRRRPCWWQFSPTWVMASWPSSATSVTISVTGRSKSATSPQRRRNKRLKKPQTKCSHLPEQCEIPNQ